MGDKYEKFKKGRESECTYTLIEKMYKALCAGMFVEVAARYCGISKTSFYSWLERGNKEPDSIYAHFLNAIELGHAEYEMRELLNIDREAMGNEAVYKRYPPNTFIEDSFGNQVNVSGDIVCDKRGNPIFVKEARRPNWAASAWRLERKFKDRWGHTQKIETSTDTAPQVIVTLPSNGREVGTAAAIENIDHTPDPSIDIIDEPAVNEVNTFMLDLPDNGRKD